MTIRGLTLGKFAPFHRGHQLVVETALGEVDELVVLAYDAPDVTTVPLPVRAGWIRSLYPEARVIETWDGPREVGDDPALERAHEECILRSLRGLAIDRFYSSEPYGAHVSRALGARDCRVDPGRARVPVSGSAMRANPFAFREHVDPLVYRDLVLDVAIVGAPSTGKSTLAERLADELGTRCMPEHGREYWERHQVGRRLTPGQLVELAREHVAREDAELLLADRVLVTDTNALTTLVFAEAWHGEAPPELARLADACARRYDVTLVCADDIPYEDTWDRSGPGDRAVLQRRLLAQLAVRRIPHVVLEGSLERRLRTARRVLAGVVKFGNASLPSGRDEAAP